MRLICSIVGHSFYSLMNPNMPALSDATLAVCSRCMGRLSWTSLKAECVLTSG